MKAILPLLLLHATSLKAQQDPNQCIELVCPEDVVVECESPQGTYVQFGIQAESLCQSKLTVTCTPESGTLFPPGETVVQCVVQDDLGNSESCSFTVYVVDSQPPELFVPQDMEVKCEDWRGAQVFFQGAAEDACDGGVELQFEPPSGSIFPHGRTFVRAFASDSSGNTEEATFLVNVTGECGSGCVVMECPQDIVANAADPNGMEVEFQVAASHQCGGTVSVTCNPPSGSVFPIGRTTVFCFADDGSGNGVACSFDVIVNDAVPPVITVPGDLETTCDAEDGSALVYFDVGASDNLDPDLQLLCDPPSGSRFPSGTTTVKCEATDEAGNRTEKTFKVTVVPGSVCGQELPLPDDSGADNWGFELGLVGWSAEGGAIHGQPLSGNVIPVRRFPELSGSIAEKIGGDYWRDIPFPVGHQGDRWVGTGDGPGSDSGIGDLRTGQLISKSFTIEKNFVSFLIGGDDIAGELQVQLVLETVGPNNTPEWQTIQEATGHGSDLLRRDWWNVASWKGQKARILIQDLSPQGHINVDDFRFSDIEPSQDLAEVGRETFPLVVFRDGFFYDWDAPVWGLVDLHTHPMSHLGFGQKVFHGEPGGDITVALGDCNCSHGGFGVDNPCGNYFREAVLKAMDSEGPDPHREGYHENQWLRFRKWPVFTTISHQQMWHEWIRRAYDGGLRVMVALCVNNQLLAAAALGDHPRDDKTVGDNQIQGLKDFVAANSDIMEIALNPHQLREIVRRNKLAIIIGSELDDMGNFTGQSGVTGDMVRAEIRRLHELGVRYIFPIHLVNNPFGGAAMYNQLFNVANKYMTGVPFSAEPANAGDGINFKLEKLDLLGLIDPGEAVGFFFAGPLVLPALASPLGDAIISTLQPGFPPGTASGMMGAVAPAIPAAMGALFPPAAGAAVAYLADAGISPDVLPIGGNYSEPPDTTTGHINSLGLTDLGLEAVREMMRLGMMIDIDHMSQKAVDDIISLTTTNFVEYPLNSGHNTFREMRIKVSENNRTPEQLERIRRSGGLMGIGYGNEEMKSVDSVLPVRMQSSSTVANSSAGTSRSFAQSYLYALEKMQGCQVALGSDVNGFVVGPGPRFGPQGAFGLTEGEPDNSHRRAAQIRSQYNGVAYTPVHGRPILGAAFDGRGVDQDKERETPLFNDGFEYNKEQRDFFAAIRIFKWKPDMSQSEAAMFEGLLSDNYNRRTVKEFLIGLLIGVTNEDPGSDIFDGDVGTKQQLGKAIYRHEALGEPVPSDVRNDREKNRRYELLLKVWRHYHRIYGDNTPLVRCETAFKQWDINFEGVAHYGLLPDFFQDLKNVGMSPRDLGPLFNGAECFANMWTHCLESAETLDPRFLESAGVLVAGNSLQFHLIDTANEFVLEAASNLEKPDWKEINGGEVTVEGLVTTVHIPLPDSTQFYRLRKRD